MLEQSQIGFTTISWPEEARVDFALVGGGGGGGGNDAGHIGGRGGDGSRGIGQFPGIVGHTRYWKCIGGLE